MAAFREKTVTDDFDMPDASHTFAERGGWVLRQLAADFNITLEQAAGIVGNVGFESGHFTKLHEIGQPEGRGGYGWGQWTSSRRVSFLAWCDKHGLDWKSDAANYGYLCEELDGPYNATLDALDDCDTVEKAVMSVGQTYERPGGTTPDHLPGYSERVRCARIAMAGATAMPPIDDQPAVADRLHPASFLARLRATV